MVVTRSRGQATQGSRNDNGSTNSNTNNSGNNGGNNASNKRPRSPPVDPDDEEEEQPPSRRFRTGPSPAPPSPGRATARRGGRGVTATTGAAPKAAAAAVQAQQAPLEPSSSQASDIGHDTTMDGDETYVEEDDTYEEPVTRQSRAKGIEDYQEDEEDTSSIQAPENGSEFHGWDGERSRSRLGNNKDQDWELKPDNIENDEPVIQDMNNGNIVMKWDDDEQRRYDEGQFEYNISHSPCRYSQEEPDNQAQHGDEQEQNYDYGNTSPYVNSPYHPQEESDHQAQQQQNEDGNDLPDYQSDEEGVESTGQDNAEKGSDNLSDLNGDDPKYNEPLNTSTVPSVNAIPPIPKESITNTTTEASREAV
jgi:hypothetical protein